MSSQNHKVSKKEKITALIKKLASLSVKEREDIASQIQISNPEGRVLSGRNQLLIFIQAPSDVVNQLTVVAGFRQWNKYGRRTRKGQHGMYVAIPANAKNDQSSESQNEDENPDYFIYKAVFDILQTEETKKTRN